jgi:hypothetical protein
MFLDENSAHKIGTVILESVKTQLII